MDSLFYFYLFIFFLVGSAANVGLKLMTLDFKCRMLYWLSQLGAPQNRIFKSILTYLAWYFVANLNEGENQCSKKKMACENHILWVFF